MFKKRPNTTPLPSEYPKGTFIETERGYFYTLGPERRFFILSTRVLDSWSPQRIAKASENHATVKKMKVTGKLKFRNGSLLYSQADGKMYLISDNKRRHITNPDILVQIGGSRQEAVWVSEKEIQLHEEGVPLS